MQKPIRALARNERAEIPMITTITLIIGVLFVLGMLVGSF